MNRITTVPHDDALQHLALALDPAAMQAVLEESIFRSNRRYLIRACDIERIRYKPRKNCLVCYRVQVEDTISQVTREQLVSVRLYKAGDSHSRFARAQIGALVTPSYGRPIAHLPELDMVVWAFPNDRKLKGLPQLTDPAHLRTKLLPPLIASHAGPDWQIAALTHELAHYNPEHTCTVRIHLQLERKDTGDRQPWVLYGKAYGDREGAETYQVMDQLWNQQGCASACLRIPKPLGYDAELNLLWQQGLPGQTLLAIEVDNPDFLVWIERAAAAVASLHQARLACPRSASVDVWVAKLKVVREWLPSARPSWRPELERLVDRLVAHAAQLGDQPTALLHGDLHLKNFLLVDQEIALIDLDNVGFGSPWQDVARLIAALLYRGLASGASGAVTANAVDCFHRSYERNTPWRISPQNLNWFVATALIIRVLRSVTLFDGRPGGDLFDALVKLAAQISDSGAPVAADKNP